MVLLFFAKPHFKYIKHHFRHQLHGESKTIQKKNNLNNLDYLQNSIDITLNTIFINKYMDGARMNNMDCVHINFQNLIVTTLNTITFNSYKLGVRIETTKYNGDNRDCVQIIFQNLIVTTFHTITINSPKMGVGIETKKIM